MNATLQTQHDEKRRLYMDGKISHLEFYSWLGDSIGISDRTVPVTEERLVASTDEHFNDITLITWDRMDPIVRGMAVRHGMKSWSLSDTVCVLKARATRMKERAISEAA